MTSISAGKHVTIGHTPYGTARDYYPGLGSDQNKFSLTSTATGITLNFEQHASVSPIEQFGMNLMGYNIVNVAQKLDLNYSQGKLAVSSATDLFPSATLSLNGKSIMQYNQPSFESNFRMPIVNSSAPVEGGVISYYDDSYKPAVWYPRQ